MKKAFSILSFILFATFGFAQQAINQTLIDYFENLNKAQVPTGILVEQGFPMYDLDTYKGQVLTDSNKVKGIAKGTFAFRAIDPIGPCKDTITVTDGFFDMKYLVQ